MGRPIKKSFFGNPAAAGAQIVLNSARIAGQSAATGYYIVRQVGTGRFQVTNGTLTGVVRLVGAGALQHGEAHVIVKPFGGADEYARVIHNRTVKTWSGNVYKWNDAAAAAAGEAVIVGVVDTPAVWSVQPAITGTARVGFTLTGSVGVMNDVDGGLGSLTLRWMSAATTNGVYTAITGATAATYVVGVGQLGRFIKHEVTATDVLGGSTVALSAATTVVIAA
jgi:hypothetical protein